MTNDTDCNGCALHSRRQFLGTAGALLVMSSLTAEGTSPIGEIHAESTANDVATYPIPAQDGVSIDKKTQVILVRFRNKVMAFVLSCPHENTALRWRQGDLRFQCPKHESKYTPEGVFTTGRATRNMDRFAISRADNSVAVQLNKWYHSDSQAAEWTAAAVALS